MAFNATPKSPSANSYATVEEADAYFLTRLTTDVWTACTTGDKQKALMWACTLLERGFTWHGGIRDVLSRLAWPRSGVFDRDGREYDFDTVPAPLKEAQCELALALISRDRTAEPDLAGLGFSEATLGPIRVKIDAEQVLPLIPALITSMLAGFGEPVVGTQGNAMQQVKFRRA